MKENKPTLKELFIAPPFSVLDASGKEAIDCKNKYILKGIRSELGRKSLVYTASSSKDKDHVETLSKGWADGTSEYRKKLIGKSGGISIFSPFVCEVMYKWFCPDGGSVLDPFAGGAIRGVVAKEKLLKYTGIELRKEQVDANFQQANSAGYNDINWICGDSNIELDKINETFDFVFSCPPIF